MGSRRDFYYYTKQLPNEEGFFPLEDIYLGKIDVDEGLWLIGDAPSYWVVREKKRDGIVLKPEVAPNRSAFGTDVFGVVEKPDYQLPAMRRANEMMPIAPFAIEVEHTDDGTGDGEMVIELYSKDKDGFIKQSTDDDLDAMMAQSFESLLKLQVKTMEMTAEIGDAWIRFLKYQKRRK